MLRAASNDPTTRQQYDMREKALKDLVSMKAGAREEGKKEGKKEGKEEGEIINSIKVATKMLKKGMAIENIIEFTELPKETILDLRKQLEED